MFLEINELLANGVYVGLFKFVALEFTGRPPSQVTGLSGSAISDTQIDLVWNANSETNVESYNIYRDSEYIASSTSTSFSDAGLLTAIQYSYEVSVVGADGQEGRKSNTVSLTTNTLSSTTETICGSEETTSESEETLGFGFIPAMIGLVTLTARIYRKRN